MKRFHDPMLDVEPIASRIVGKPQRIGRTKLVTVEISGPAGVVRVHELRIGARRLRTSGDRQALEGYAFTNYGPRGTRALPRLGG